MRQSSIIIHKGRRDEKYRIYIEDYVLSYLRRETGTLELSEFYFYGFRENNNRKYIIYGAGRDKRLAVFDKYNLLNEIGCRLTQAGPVFFVRESDNLYEVKGYEVFYQDNKEMQSYLIEQKKEISTSYQNVAEKKMDQSVHMNGADSRETVPNKVSHSMISVQLGIILVALVAIVINSTNSYDKMEQLNRSASEVLFAIENQEAGKMAGTNGRQDEITVERNAAQEGALQENIQPDEPDSNAAVSDAGREEDVLKLAALENEEQAEENQSEESSGAGSNDNVATTVTDETAAVEEENRNESQSGEGGEYDEIEALSRNVARYYEVEKGDTLYTISQKIYGDTTFVEKICELNQISDPDHIRYGQKIILP